MRDQLSVLYYPEYACADATMKKCALLFDEIHFMDQPSFSLPGNFALAGADSPFRAHEQTFRENGIPLYVHEVAGGFVHGELWERVISDLSDMNFLACFQDGLRSSARFRELHLRPGDYGLGETHHSVYEKLAALDLRQFPNVLHALEDTKVEPFRYRSPQEIYRFFACQVAFCSVKMNFALLVGTREGFTPLADASPYATLLSTKFARAASEQSNPRIPFPDLSMAIFDELVSPERLRTLTYGEVFKYRKESERAREAFLEMLVAFHSKAGNIPGDGDYAKSIQRIIDSEVRPAAREFKDKLKTIHDNLFGKITDSTIRWVGGSAIAQVVTGMSWEKMLTLAVGIVASSAVAQLREAKREKKSARRECALSYVLDLESQ